MSLTMYWRMTEESWNKMINEGTEDFYGAVDYGHLCSEFHITVDGSEPFTNTYDIHPDYQRNGYAHTNNGTPYELEDYDLPVPKTKTFEEFKLAFECAVIYNMLTNEDFKRQAQGAVADWR